MAQEEATDFLGQPFKAFTCSSCKSEFRSMSIDRTRVCPTCQNERDHPNLTEEENEEHD